jgi:hypothetical protein
MLTCREQVWVFPISTNLVDADPHSIEMVETFTHPPSSGTDPPKAPVFNFFLSLSFSTPIFFEARPRVIGRILTVLRLLG